MEIPKGLSDKDRRLLESVKSGKALSERELVDLIKRAGYEPTRSNAHIILQKDGKKQIVIPHSPGMTTISTGIQNRVLKQILDDIKFS